MDGHEAPKGPGCREKQLLCGSLVAHSPEFRPCAKLLSTAPAPETSPFARKPELCRQFGRRPEKRLVPLHHLNNRSETDYFFVPDQILPVSDPQSVFRKLFDFSVYNKNKK